MDLQRVFTLVIISMTFCVMSSNSYKILVVGVPNGGSHYYVLERIAKALAQRDHDVTVYVSDMYTKHREDSSLKYVIYESLVTMNEWEDLLTKLTSSYLSGDDFLSQLLSQLKVLPILSKLGKDQCRSALDNELLMKQLRQENFDIVIGDLYLICASLVGQALNTPYVLISAPFPFAWHYSIHSSPVNPSYLPAAQTGFSNHMTFTTRLLNTVQIVTEYLVGCNARSDYDDLKEIYGIKPEVSTYLTVRQAELFFMNTDFALDYARPLMPNIIQVGGIVTKPAKPLNQDLEGYLQGADHGIIVFSLGEYISINRQDMADMFANAFARIPQRVVWRQRGRTPITVPPNVRMMEWIPQNDLLGHSKTKLLVYHCGLNGAYEAVYHGVPVICLPVFFDQLDVAQRIATKGAGLRLDINSVTSDILVEAIQRVLNENSFRTNMEKLSSIFKDKPNHPADEVALWTEYVVHHNGTGHLRSAANDLNLFQYLLLDVMLFLSICVFIVTAMMISCCKCCIGFVKSKLRNAKKDKRD